MLSLCPLTVLPCSPLEQVDAALDAGYDAVGIRLLPVLPTDIALMTDKPLRDALAKRLSQAKLDVLDVEVVRIAPHTDIKALIPMLQYAGDIGARSLAVTGVPKAEFKPEDETATAARLAELCEVAGRYGIKPALEFMAFRNISTLQEAIRFRQVTRHPNLAIVVDALHLARSGGQAQELATIDPALISCFQICDAPATAPEDLAREARFGRLLPGKGGLPLREMVTALPAKVPLAVEVPMTQSDVTPIEKAREAARTTRAILKTAAG